jgi:serine/threonine protein kinase
VHHVRNRLNGDEYAIKLIYFEVGLAALSEEEEADEEQLCIPEAKLLLDRHFLREVESQQRVHHPYVCSIQSGHWGMTETQGWILMTYCPNGSLRSLMRDVRSAQPFDALC